MESLLTILGPAALKATAVLGLAALINLLWRRASAATRHLIWTLGVISTLVIPVAIAAFSLLGLERPLISIPSPVVTLSADIPANSPGEPPAPLASAEVTSVAPEPTIMSIEQAVHDDMTTVATAPADPVDQPPTEVRMTLGALAGIVVSSMVDGLESRWMTVIAAVWLAGAILALLPLIIALGRIAVLARRAVPVRDPRWERLLHNTSSIRHLAPRVRILASADATMPMTWGLFRATLLVPRDTSRWPDWQVRDVLLHELAHVERRDCLTQFAAQVVCAIYWFNPLAWVASHRMRVERELACDDSVLTAGAVPSDYAQNLLDVARSLRAPSFTSQTAIAMARPSQLSGRLLAVLDGTRNRRNPARVAVAGAGLTAALIVGLLASISVRAASAEAAESRAGSARTSASGERGVEGAAPSLAPAPLAIVRASQVPAVGMVPSFSEQAALPTVFKSAEQVQAPSPAAGAAAIADAFVAVCWTEGDNNTSVNISNNDSGGRPTWTVRYSRDGCSFELRAEGRFTLRPDLTDVETISSGGWLRVEEREGRQTRRLEMRPAANGSIERQYWVNGDRAAFDDDARRWLAQSLLVLERRTAFAASTRVPQLYRTGGLRAVLAEISAMSSAYPRSKYYSTLLEMDAPLDNSTLNEVVRQASSDLTSSDYYMSQVLGKLGAHRSANATTWRLFADAAMRMKSDYYKSTMLKKVLSNTSLDTETVAAMLRSAGSINSDHYLTELLKAISARYALNDATRGYYAEALSKVKSDYQRASLLQSMNDAKDWDPRTTAFVLASVSDIKSDYYRSQSLIALVKNRHVGNWPAFFSAVGSMDSDHYKRETLRAVLRHDPLTRDIVAGVITAAGQIKSDYHASEVLKSVASSYKLDDSLRGSYEKVVDSMDSEHYRGTALSAMRRSVTR